MNGAQHKKSYLIIGQGIAGSILAWFLMKAGHKIVIVDQNHHKSSSIISAGIMNPITGQRLVVTPEFDQYAGAAHQLYSQISLELGSAFFVSKPIVRVLKSDKERERCHYLNSLPKVKPYIAGINPSGYFGDSVRDPFGTLTIAKGGYFPTRQLLTSLRQYFIQKKMLVSEHFVYDDLQLSDSHVTWKSQFFDAVIFCEGFKAKQNPWFGDLSYNFVKGELLKIAFDSGSLPDAILCQQQWCVPLADGTYLAGATYDRENINTISTDYGQDCILKGLSDFIAAKPRVIESYAGVRPVMLNQKPMIGWHATLARIGIFNGFASKGFLWVPYHARIFAECLFSTC
jgi:glycine/D-amino acid oxidase-like deaminating enzyme